MAIFFEWNLFMGGKIDMDKDTTESRDFTHKTRSKSITPPAGWILEYPDAHHLKGELGSYAGNKNFFTIVSQIHLLCAAAFLVYFHAVFPLTFAYLLFQ